MKAAELLVRCLWAEGVRYVFGVPGEENADFVLALQDSDIRFVMTRHEQGAAFMASVHGRLTGDPAVCLGTLGPGATNLLTGVADANMDRAPLIVLTGQAATTRLHKESHQVMDVVQMYRPVTKWAHAISSGETIPEVVRKAVRLARTEKPGAVHLELSEDIAAQETDAQPLKPRRFLRPAPNEEAVREAWARIAQAKRPIIIAGNGTIRTRASNALRDFCAVTGIGALTTFMGKGALDRDDPRCLFTIGLQQRDHAAIEVAEADLVIATGYDLVEYPPRLWNPDGKKKVVSLDFEPAEIDAHYHPSIEVIGDLADTLCRLTDCAEAAPAATHDFSGQRRLREAVLADFSEHSDDGSDRIKPQKAVFEARRALGREDILLCGVGAHKMWVGRQYPCHAPNTCLIPNGFCAMGMPLPGAIAAHLVHPERKVLGIVGDGDFMMNVQEMETARRLEADITLMIWEDHGYGLIAWKQQEEFGRQTDLAFGNPDWTALAASFGWCHWQVDNSAALRPALADALAHRGPSLVVVPIDYRENTRLPQRLGPLTAAL